MITNEDKSKAPIEQVQQVQPTETRHKGRYRIPKGHKIWEMTFATKAIKEAETEAVYDLEKKETRRKLIERPGCMYIVALNIGNAKRKFDAAIARANAKKRQRTSP